MRCGRVQELLLTDHMDGELDEKTCREVDAHVASCAVCRELTAVVRKGPAGQLASVPSAEVPSYIWERVKRRVAVEPPQPANAFSWPKILRPAIAFAAAAAVIVAVFVARPIAHNRAANEVLVEHAEFMINLGAAETNGNDYFVTDIKTGIDNLL